MSFRRIYLLVSTVAHGGRCRRGGFSAAAGDHDDLGDRSLAKVLAKDGSGSTTTRGTTTSSTTP